MADTVQRILEDMVPELEDLQQKGIFNKTEIQSLVSHRSDFEYKLRRKNISKLDFLRYIQYELNVVALIERRKDRLAITKKGVCDFSVMRRLSFLYERALRKFNHDVPLWKQYLEYCRRIGSHSAISKILPRALQLNPKDESLWILHASWELESSGNIEGARAVLQRALRLNETSKQIWLTFFKTELRYVIRVLERKRVLGLVELDGVEHLEQHGEFDLRYKEGIATGTVKGEGEDDVKQPKKDALTIKQEIALSQLLLPRAIMANALKIPALKEDVAFRLEFLRLLPTAYSAALSVLGSSDAQGGEDETFSAPSSASDPSSISLAKFAYNHEDEDVLMNNFLKYNGKTKGMLVKEERIRREKAAKTAKDGDVEMTDAAAASSAPTTTQSSTHLYHVDFLPLLTDLFTGMQTEFAYDPAVLRIVAEFEWVKGKVQQQQQQQQENGSTSTSQQQTPEQAAFAVFESALQSAALASIQSAANSYLQANQLALTSDISSAGRLRIERLKDTKKATWMCYLRTIQELAQSVRTGDAAGGGSSRSSRELKNHLSSLYTRASKEGVASVELTLTQAQTLVQSGRISEAVDVLKAAVGVNDMPVASPNSSFFPSSLALWTLLIDLVQRLHELGLGIGSSVGGESHTDEHHATGSKKRKKPASSSSSSSQSHSGDDSTANEPISISTISSLYARAVSPHSHLAPADRVALAKKQASWVGGLFVSATSTSTDLRTLYLLSHSSFQTLLRTVASSESTAFEQGATKRDFTLWMAQAVGSDAFATLKNGPTSASKAKQQDKASSQPKSKKQKRVADSDEDSDDDASNSSAPWPSSVPSLSLSPVVTVRAVVDSLLATPPVTLEFLQAAINTEAAMNPSNGTGNDLTVALSSAAAAVQVHQRRMKDLYERAVVSFGQSSPELWFSYLAWARTAPSQANANQLHFRATKHLSPEHQAHWAQLQTVLVQ